MNNISILSSLLFLILSSCNRFEKTSNTQKEFSKNIRNSVLATKRYNNIGLNKWVGHCKGNIFTRDFQLESPMNAQFRIQIFVSNLNDSNSVLDSAKINFINGNVKWKCCFKNNKFKI